MGEGERKLLAARSRWWNSTGGGTCTDRTFADLNDAPGSGWKPTAGNGARRGGGLGHGLRSGDGGQRFRLQFPEVDEENWRWMGERRVNIQTGIALSPEPSPNTFSTSSTSTGTAIPSGNPPPIVHYQDGGVQRRNMVGAGAHPVGASTAAGTAEAVVKGGESWVKRHKFLCVVVLLCGYVLLARMYE